MSLEAAVIALALKRWRPHVDRDLAMARGVPRQGELRAALEAKRAARAKAGQP